MKDIKRSSAIKVIKVLALIFFVATWILMCGNSIYLFNRSNAEFAFGPLDIVCRITAPDGKKTAILVRSYGSFLDLNFLLYVTDDNMADINDRTENASFFTNNQVDNMSNTAIWIKRALWISRDYELTTDRNWHEDIVWSDDSLVLAVIIEEQYVFAYDFSVNQTYEDAQEIWESILESNTLDWLLEKNNPSVRYFTLIDILDYPGTEQDVIEAKNKIMGGKLVSEIFSKQKGQGYWEKPESFYKTKYKGTVWQLIIDLK